MGKTSENFMKIHFIATAAALMIALNPALADDSITEAEVIAAQEGWCNALVEISATNAKSGQAAAKALAESVIDSAYAYQMGPVLFNDWTACQEDNAAIFISGNTASTMGKVHFTDKDGNVTTVDKTWQFVKDDNGQLRIVVHHSSLEYTPDHSVSDM
jgi:hypothetical protein